MKFVIAALALVGSNQAITIQKKEYPRPEMRGPIPQIAHPDSPFTSHLHNDYTNVQTKYDLFDSNPDMYYEGQTYVDRRMNNMEDPGDFVQLNNPNLYYEGQR